MVKDEDLKELAHPEYWNQRYASAEKESKDGSAAIASLEWFRTFANLRPFFEKYLPAASIGYHILNLGCGNSVSSVLRHKLEIQTQSPPVSAAEELNHLQAQPADVASSLIHRN